MLAAPAVKDHKMPLGGPGKPVIPLGLGCHLASRWYLAVLSEQQWQGRQGLLLKLAEQVHLVWSDNWMCVGSATQQHVLCMQSVMPTYVLRAVWGSAGAVTAHRFSWCNMGAGRPHVVSSLRYMLAACAVRITRCCLGSRLLLMQHDHTASCHQAA